MTRPPPGPSFAQFFPQAPKLRGDTQYDRSKSKPHVLESSPPQEGSADSHSAHTPHHPDAHESPPADIPSTVGSTSSHTSSVSSVISGSTRPTVSTVSSRLSSVVALNSKDSPSTPSHAKLDMPASSATDRVARPPSHDPSLNGYHNGSMSDGLTAGAYPPARDPSSSAKGTKCTHDPLLDRKNKKNVSRSAKPTYEEFGSVCIPIPSFPSGGASSWTELVANAWIER
jgi:histone-lysine N-methyltransferase SETD1